MSDYIAVSLSNGLFNAGILGLIRFMDFAGFEYFKSEGQDLYVHKDFFAKDLAALYIDFIYDQFKDESAFTSFISTEIDTASDDYVKNINILKNKTPVKVCEIYQDTHFIELRDQINLTKDIDAKKILIKALQQYLDENKELLKYQTVADVVRNIFSLFFGSFGFLSTSQGSYLINTNKVNDVHLTFEESLNQTIFDSLRFFIENSEEYLKNKGMNCIQCGNFGNSQNKLIALSFLNDFVDDPNRKNSAFWNYKVDAFACPLCAFVYSLMPFGFMSVAKGKYNKDYLFINTNDSIDTIKNINSTEDYKKEQEINKLTVLNHIVAKELENKFKELNYIEIILRINNIKKRNFYSYEVIGKDVLSIVKSCNTNLERILNKFVKVGKDDWLDVFKEVINNILTFQNQWTLLNSLIRLDADRYTLNNILSIQINQNSIKEGYSAMDVEGKIKSAKLSGIELKEYFGAEAENKLRSYIYRLVNALGSNNLELFLDTVVRMYSGINKAIPHTFINLFASDESFKEIGYAYLIGLKTEKMEEK